MRTISYCRKSIFWWAGLLSTLACLAAPIRALAESQTTGAQPTTAPPSLLQVSGTKESVTLIADHADVLRVLSKLFEIADQDFKADQTVDGVVTMRLSNKPPETVLQAVCQQAMLTYQLDNGVYALTANVEARQRAAQQTNLLGNRALGLDGMANSGFRPLLPSGQAIRPLRQNPFAFNLEATRDDNKPYGSRSQLDDPSLNVQVELHISKDNPIPVVDALKALAAQAKIPLEISPDVPQGMKFRIWAHITNHTLLDALELLAPTARLEWRVIDGKLRIWTAPEFQIFYGDSNVPRASYPPIGKQTAPNRAVPSKPDQSPHP